MEASQAEPSPWAVAGRIWGFTPGEAAEGGDVTGSPFGKVTAAAVWESAGARALRVGMADHGVAPGGGCRWRDVDTCGR